MVGASLHIRFANATQVLLCKCGWKKLGNTEYEATKTCILVDCFSKPCVVVRGLGHFQCGIDIYKSVS